MASILDIAKQINKDYSNSNILRKSRCNTSIQKIKLRCFRNGLSFIWWIAVWKNLCLFR